MCHWFQFQSCGSLQDPLQGVPGGQDKLDPISYNLQDYKDQADAIMRQHAVATVASFLAELHTAFVSMYIVQFP